MQEQSERIFAEMAAGRANPPPVLQRVRVHAEDVVRDMVECGKAEQEAAGLRRAGRDNEATSSSSNPNSRAEEGASLAPSSLQERKLAQRKAQEEEQARRAELVRQEVKHKQEQAVAEREARFQKMYATVLDGLDYADGITGDVQSTLETSTRQKAAMRQKLFLEWEAAVSNPIHRRLQKAVSDRKLPDITRRLQRHYNAYLKTTNSKPVFRDVVIEADYNPLLPNKQALKVVTADLWDPLKRDFMKKVREQQEMGSKLRGGRAAVPKTMLEPELWGVMESTIYGHHMTPDGDYQLQPPSAAVLALRKSVVMLDHYGFPCGKVVVDAECPKGKRPVPAAGRRAGLWPLLNPGPPSASGSAAPGMEGDWWMDAKGKKTVPGPEMRRGRKDLYDVIHHACGERPGFTGGDRWLEAKGKCNVPGPEARRGRRGLWETFQQSSNPYDDGRTLDDLWLEHRGRRQVGQPFDDSDMYGILSDDNITVAPQHDTVKRFRLSQLEPSGGSITTKLAPN